MPEDICGATKRRPSYLYSREEAGAKKVMEESWDCPCHGSGYNKEGFLLDNPAEEDLEM